MSDHTTEGLMQLVSEFGMMSGSAGGSAAVFATLAAKSEREQAARLYEEIRSYATALCQQGEPEVATTEQLIELAGALEQRRALAIVKDVAALATDYSDGSFTAGFETACEEITHRLRTEVWAGCLPPVDAALSTSEGKTE